jgi:hypothetical protein
MLIKLLHDQGVNIQAVRKWPKAIRIGLRSLRELHDQELEVQAALKVQREALENLKKDIRKRRLAKSAQRRKNKAAGGREGKKQREEGLQKRLTAVQEARKAKEAKVSELEIRASNFKECEEEHARLLSEAKQLVAELMVLAQEEDNVTKELEEVSAGRVCKCW